MEPIPVINELKQAQLTPVNEFMLIIQKRYNSCPNSLAAAGYREVMKMAEDFLSAERQFMNAAFTAGYEQAFEDLRNHNKTEPQKEAENGGDK